VPHLLRLFSAVLVTTAIVVAALAVPRAQQAPVFRTGVDLVNLALTVSDRKGNLVAGLKQGDFEIFEDGAKQTIRYFSAGDLTGPAPETHLGVLIDVSGSMAPTLGFVQGAVIKFFNNLTDAVDITVVDFDSEVRSARYSRADVPRLVERVRSLKINGATAVYDAIGVYLNSAQEQDGRKILLLYTDGDDNASSLSLPGLLDLLKASDVTVYSIGVMDRPTPRTLTFMAILNRIAEISGGEAFFPKTVNELDGAYKRVLQQIKAQYTIGYVSTNQKPDGGWRKVNIKIVAKDGRDYRVKTRDGYYAQYKPEGRS
jgi:Ca-activated chloride channel family protein